MRGGPLPQIREDRLWQGDRFTPSSPGPFPLVVRGAQLQRERRPILFGVGSQVTALRHLDACPVGLADFHPVVSSKGELADGEHRNGLEVFIGGWEAIRLQIPITRLLDEVRHGHKAIGIFQIGSQSADPLLDGSIIFSSRTFFLGWSDQAFREQRQNALENLFATRLGPQDSFGLLHFAALPWPDLLST